MRELLRYVLPPVGLVIAAVAAVALAWAGPFGTYGAVGFGTRLGYWAAISLLSVVLARLLRLVIHRRMSGASYALREAVTVLVFSVLFTAVVMAANQFVFGPTGMALPGWWPLFGVILLVSVGVSMVIWLVVGERDFSEAPARVRALGPAAPSPAQTRPRRAEAAEEAPAAQRIDPAAEARFLAEHAPEVGQLLRLEVEDHYVGIIGTRGRVMVLMRMRDACAALAGADGMQVHRSHWVARRAIERVERAGGRLVLHTRDGAAVPVSRARRKELEAAGWLPPPRSAPPGG